MDESRSVQQGKHTKSRYIAIDQSTGQNSPGGDNTIGMSNSYSGYSSSNQHGSMGFSSNVSTGHSNTIHSNASHASTHTMNMSGSYSNQGSVVAATASSSSSPLHGIDPLLLSIHEYLIYIGLSNTASSLLKEVKTNPPLPYHQAGKLVTFLLNYIHQLQFSSFLHDWNLLAEKFQFPSNESLQMKFSLVKYYFVTCVRKGKVREIENVLKEHAWWMYRHDTFKEWFVLPFLLKSGSGTGVSNMSNMQNNNLSTGNGAMVSEVTFHESLHFDGIPSSNDASYQKQISYLNKIPLSLKVYFEQQWFEILTISLHNFLQTAISNSQQKPMLMTMERDYEKKISRLEKKQILLERENFILERKMKAMFDWIKKKSREQKSTLSRRVGSEDLDTINGMSQSILHKPQEVLSDHTGPIDALKFSIGGLYLATASSEAAELKIYSSSSDHRSQSYSLSSLIGNPNSFDSLTSSFIALEWSRVSEQLLFVGMNNRKVKVFNASKKKKVSTLVTDSLYPNILNICSNPAQQNCIAISSCQQVLTPKGKQVNKSKPLSHLITVDFQMSQTIRQFKTESPLLYSSYNHNGKLLAVGSMDGTVQIIDPSSPKSVIMEWSSNTSPLTCVYFSPDETTLWTCSKDGAIRQWDMHKEGVCLREWKVEPKENLPVSMVISPGEEQGNSFLTSTGSLFEDTNDNFEIFTETHRFQVDSNPMQFSCIDWNIAEGLITASYKNNTYVYNSPFVYH